MGMSFDHATLKKTSAKFGAHDVIYDRYKNFYYHPFWKNDSLYIKEYRLDGKDTVFQRTEKISWIIGSGQHTNSHLWMENGYLYQAPMTFYTQQQVWDLPPGFEGGLNTRWNRVVTDECMTCHNMYPVFDSTSENHFINIKTGIECERCHGPGSIHVAEKEKGIIVDTSKEIDYSIVNPKRLPRDLQVELCQRCHLQGITVLNEGKSFFDYRPGMKLNTVMNVFMPRYEGGENKFIMASHADRMKQSKCYLNSNMTCLTCHNPHISVRFTEDAHFNGACISCHSNSDSCKLSFAERIKTNDNNCYKCHMPVSTTLDIPHVTVHDHRIQIPVSSAEKDSIQRFIGLACMTDNHPSDLLMAEGYLETYEAYSAQPYLLDSAAGRLNKVSDRNDLYRKTQIRYYYLKNDYGNVIAASKNFSAQKKSDAWTNYRIGEAYFQSGNFTEALHYYHQAVSTQENNLDFENKLGSVFVALHEVDSAQNIFQKIVSNNPKFATGVCNLGYTYFLKGDLVYAEKLFLQSLSLDPDYEQALLNEAQLCAVQHRNQDAKKFLQRALIVDPQNEKVKIALESLSRS